MLVCLSLCRAYRLPGDVVVIVTGGDGLPETLRAAQLRAVSEKGYQTPIGIRHEVPAPVATVYDLLKGDQSS